MFAVILPVLFKVTGERETIGDVICMSIQGWVHLTLVSINHVPKLQFILFISSSVHAGVWLVVVIIGGVLLWTLEIKIDIEM